MLVLRVHAVEDAAARAGARSGAARAPGVDGVAARRGADLRVARLGHLGPGRREPGGVARREPGRARARRGPRRAAGRRRGRTGRSSSTRARRRDRVVPAIAAGRGPRRTSSPGRPARRPRRTRCPRASIVLGGGVAGCELAQLYRRLGSRGDDRPARRAAAAARATRRRRELLQAAFEEEGIAVRLGARVEHVADGHPRSTLAGGEDARGRAAARRHRPQAERRGARARAARRRDLEARHRGRRRLRAAENVWAIGDCTGIALFTHVGKYQARDRCGEHRRRRARAPTTARSPRSRSPTRRSRWSATPSGEDAVSARWEIDRHTARLDIRAAEAAGFLKLVADPERRIVVGAVAVGPEAGEWCQQLTLAIRAEVPIDVLRDVIQPFPTFSEAVFFALQELAL